MPSSTVRLALLLAATLAAATAAEGDSIPEEGGVLVLTNETLPLALKNNPFLLVEFFAPWCGHCKALEPEYAKAAAQLQAENSNLRLAKIDVTEFNDVGTQYEIQGFPTLKFFTEGRPPADYQGQRTAESIVTWLKRKSGPAAKAIAEPSELTALKQENPVVVVGFFKDVSSPAAQAFLTVAFALDYTPFAIASSDALFVDGKVSGQQGVALFKQFDEGRSDFSGDDYTVEALTSFVKAYSRQLVPEFSVDKAQEIFGDLQEHLLLFFPKGSDPAAYETAVQNAKKVAPKYRGKIAFVAIDSDSEDASRVADYFSLKKHHFPTYRLAVFSETGMKRYKPDSSEITEERLASFMASYESGQLQPYLLSEDLPADWEAHAVKVLVGSNYKTVTRDSGKKVIVELYAPWCGHCKQLAPIWEQLGEKYKEFKDVIVAKMDATANEVEGLQLFSYPTIKLYLPGADKEIDYYGARTVEGFSKFIDTDGAEQAPAPEEAEVASEDEASNEETAEGDVESVDQESQGDGHDHHDDHSHDGHGHDHSHTEL